MDKFMFIKRGYIEFVEYYGINASDITEYEGMRVIQKTGMLLFIPEAYIELFNKIGRKVLSEYKEAEGDG